MAGTTVRLDLAEARLREALTGPAGMAYRYVTTTTNDIRNLAVQYTPVDTGRLRGSLAQATAVKVNTTGWTVTGTVGTDVDYAVYVHEGLTDRDVVVRAHDVRSHTIKAHRVAARTQLGYTVPAKGERAAYEVKAHTVKAHRVAARTQLSHTVPAHTRHQRARAGRPFLRQAMDEVLDGQH